MSSPLAALLAEVRGLAEAILAFDISPTFDARGSYTTQKAAELAALRIGAQDLLPRLLALVEPSIPVDEERDDDRRIERAIKEGRRLTARVRALEAALGELATMFHDISEDKRLTEQHAHEATARRHKAEGDMYGWNFHMGLAAGMNTADILYQRLGRSLRALLAQREPPRAEGTTGS